MLLIFLIRHCQMLLLRLILTLTKQFFDIQFTNFKIILTADVLSIRRHIFHLIKIQAQ